MLIKHMLQWLLVAIGLFINIFVNRSFLIKQPSNRNLLQADQVGHLFVAFIP